ncbi:MAG: SPOR domain-containing protein [Gammaproteobacteria bacterium]|nr:SPOR domain-containing protein [Gammaproteobacteria bacterium]
MAKEFAKKTKKSQQGQGLSAVWLCFLTFVFGYLAASWFDVNQLGHWVTAHLHGSAVQQAPSQMQASAPVHPKLEFYTLLANESPSKSDMASKALAETEGQYQDLSTKQSSEPMVSAESQATNRPVLPVPKALTKAPPKKPAADNVVPNYSPDGAYSVQVGSFRAYNEAQRMIAKLRAKGLHVEMVSVHQQSTYWYRVMLGPFASLPQAQQAQIAFAHQEHINGMIRKSNS